MIFGNIGNEEYHNEDYQIKIVGLSIGRNANANFFTPFG